jgi:hypothetical protein
MLPFKTAGALTGEGLVSASLDLAAPKLGSGARFKKLSATLAKRGASNPDALAAYIGRKKYGAAKFGKLSAGKSLANEDLGIYLAVTAKDSQGKTLVCPECNYSGPANRFGASGASQETAPADLRTPAPGTGAVRDGVPLTVKANSAHALSNTRHAVELATGTIRRPIQGPMDVLVKREEDGTALLRHRNGGAEIARLRRTDDGKWVATVGGRELQPRDHQRTALMEAVGTWNGAITSAAKRQEAPLQPPPQQTELMAEYGIPAMRSAAFATPTTSSASGPRMTTAGGSGKYDPDNDGDDDSSPSGDTDKDAVGGLSPKALAIYKKLKAKGFPDARALAFAKNSEKFGKPAKAAA